MGLALVHFQKYWLFFKKSLWHCIVFELDLNYNLFPRAFSKDILNTMGFDFYLTQRTFECQKTSETDNLTFYESTFVGKEKSFLCDLQCLFVILLMCRHTFTGPQVLGPKEVKTFFLNDLLLLVASTNVLLFQS